MSARALLSSCVQPQNSLHQGLIKGAVGAYWGCCRGCGAHLIWVTTIDAFCPKKSLRAARKAIYFTVLHIPFSLGPESAHFGNFCGAMPERRIPDASLPTLS